jgi:hypothetical protein
VPDDNEKPDVPSTDQPLHGPRRRTTGPLLLVLAVIGVLIVLYAAGVAFLVD